MAKIFHCCCFNVNIIVSGGGSSDWKGEDESLAKIDTFFSNASLVSSSNDVVIDKKIQCLCHTRQIDDWIINFCLHCGMDTHATNKTNQKSHLILISTNLETSSPAFEVNELNTYSPFYKILIGNHALKQSLKESHISIPQSLLRNRLEELKDHTLQLLNAENEIVLDRIRNFETEQLAKFAELQTKLQQQRNIIIQTLMAYQEEEKDQHIPNATVKIASPPHESSRPIKVKHNNNSQGTSRPVVKENLHDDIMFVMDDEDDSDDTYAKQATDTLESKDQLPDTEEDDDDVLYSHLKDSQQLYATSLPISMPGKWQLHHQQKESIEDVDVPKETGSIKDPQWIAANIQALAMSVRGNDGTEMFGARPRPRLNTMD